MRAFTRKDLWAGDIYRLCCHLVGSRSLIDEAFTCWLRAHGAMLLGVTVGVSQGPVWRQDDAAIVCKRRMTRCPIPVV